MRIHPLSKTAVNDVPFIAGLIGFAIVPAMFLHRKTFGYAYVINGMLVIIGAITMTHFSLVHPPEQITLSTILENTLLPDIAILFTNFALGKALFELEIFKSEGMPARQGRFFRYPNTGWWFVHLFSLSAVYLMGHYFWK